MKQRKIVALVGASIGVGFAAAAGNAHAQASGTTTVGIGWLHIMPQGSSDETVVESIGGRPVDQPINGTGAHVGTSDAASFSIEYHITDHVGVAFLAGSPFTSDLIGDGTLSRYGVVGKSKPMAPVLEARYHFLAADARFRPYVALGVNYTWFTDTRLTNNDFIDASFGPGSSTHATLSASWNPTLAVGASYAIAKHWSAGFSLTYIPMSTNLTTYAKTAVGADMVTKTKIRTNPLITLFNVAYTF
ncbi:OmpW/AlkL family protein [Burkholderia sp. MR1-5-21]